LSKSNEILTANAPETWYNVWKFGENGERDTPLRGVYIPHFDHISVKIAVLGVQYPYCRTNGVKFGKWDPRHGGGEVSSPVPKLTPIGATCPCGAKNLKIGLSNLNTGALRCTQCCR